MGPYWRQTAQLRGYFCNLAERWWWPNLSWWQPGWKEKKDFERYLRGRPETICRLSFPFLRQSFPSPLGQLGTPIPSGLLSPPLHPIRPCQECPWAGCIWWSRLCLASCCVSALLTQLITSSTWCVLLLASRKPHFCSFTSLTAAPSVSSATLSSLHLLPAGMALDLVLIPLLYLLSLPGDLIQLPGFKYHPYATGPQKCISRSVKPPSQTPGLNIQLLTWYLLVAGSISHLMYWKHKSQVSPSAPDLLSP